MTERSEFDHTFQGKVRLLDLAAHFSLRELLPLYVVAHLPRPHKLAYFTAHGQSNYLHFCDVFCVDVIVKFESVDHLDDSA